MKAVTSLSFRISNGTRQGKILSPSLCKVYTDYFGAALRDTGSGCHSHDTCVNSLSYAYDMVLLAPTMDALQDLISVCEVYVATHDIVCNTPMTECMVIPPVHIKATYMSSAKLNRRTFTFVN